MDLKKLIEAAGEDEVTDDKYENLSKKQLVDIICSAVDTAIDGQKKSSLSDVEKLMRPNIEKVGQIEKALMTVVAGLGLQETKKKFTDFDEHKEQVIEVMKKYPGIDYEDAYIIAKGKKAGVPRVVADTERPDDYGTPPSNQNSKSDMTDDAFAVIANRGREARGASKISESGVVGFRGIVEAALDKVLSDK